MAQFTDRYGTAGADTLTGTGANQMLFGGAGDDLLRAGPHAGNWLLGGSGADTYTYTSGSYNMVVLETGGSANDRFTEGFGVEPADTVVTIDSRHLMFFTSKTGDAALFLDWQRPENVIETWQLGTATFTFQELVTGIGGIPAYKGDQTLESVLGPTDAAAFRALIDQAYAKAAAAEGGGATPGAVTGTAGADGLVGTAGNDTMHGLQGDDTLDGSLGADALYGNQGADQLTGGSGADTLFGGQSGDALWGGAEADVLYGNMAEDTLFGDAGDDTLFGGQGPDALSGGEGADVLAGNVGDDALTGGAGADRFVLTQGGGRDTVSDFNAAEGDRLQLSGGTFQSVAADAGGNAVVTASHGGAVVLVGVTAADFSTEWIV
ncbi:MAG TPA: calcium-binding protein [Azospirillum sp.]